MLVQNNNPVTRADWMSVVFGGHFPLLLQNNYPLTSADRMLAVLGGFPLCMSKGESEKAAWFSDSLIFASIREKTV